MPEMLSTEFDQETVLMSISAGAYYGLEGPARSVWNLLETPQTLNQLVDRLLGEYDVSREDCAADVERFLGELDREGLLRVE
jgi:hypothetical protein